MLKNEESTVTGIREEQTDNNKIILPELKSKSNIESDTRGSTPYDSNDIDKNFSSPEFNLNKAKNKNDEVITRPSEEIKNNVNDKTEKIQQLNKKSIEYMERMNYLKSIMELAEAIAESYEKKQKNDQREKANSIISLESVKSSTEKPTHKVKKSKHVKTNSLKNEI